MLDRTRILTLIPHQGVMCLLDRVLHWNGNEIVCQASSHLDAGNPLRHAEVLGPAGGIEYGLQAAALHGALRAGEVPLPAGRLAALRGVRFYAGRLDDPTLGALKVTACMEASSTAGVSYAFHLFAAHGGCILEGHCLIALPDPQLARTGRRG
jgi:predicted hotdog family 3-hydroxylacyl-ACP dehydratase